MIVGVELTCRIPETYPDTPPGVGVEVTKGLSAKQGEELLALAKAQVSEVCGTA
ncbi:unnamed protein product, partial [Discosporangium mesarthrocarpum]